MAEPATQKLNNVFPEATEFTLCPVQFFGYCKDGKLNPFSENGKPLARSKIKILNVIYTARKNFKNYKLSKKEISRRTGLSYSVVLASLNQLKYKDNLISKTDSDIYKIIPTVNGKNYFVLDNYLNTKKFNIDGKIKKLSATAVMILNRLKSFYLEKDKDGNYINYNFKDRKPINYFKSSEQGFATLLNLPKSTVSYTIKQLLKAGLIYRNKRLKYKDNSGKDIYKTVQIKGITGNTQSIFAVPYEILAVEQRSTYKPQEIDFIEKLDEIEITDGAIEKVYAELRQEAENKTVEARKLAYNDNEFISAKEELDNAINATFNALKTDENVAESKELWNAAQARYYKRLAVLGISEEELTEPPYLCHKCNDTGFTDTGQRCRCRSNIKQLIVSRLFKRK